jgi:DNA polymerase I-like protein with 3'-5' exonuclease and polymerase domains
MLPMTKIFIVDVECQGLSARYDASVPVFFVGLMTVDENSKASVKGYTSVSKAVEKVQELLDSGWVAVGHNIKFDLGVLMSRGLKFTIEPGILSVMDTMVMAYHRETNLPSYSLGYLTGEKENLLESFKADGLVDDKCTLKQIWATDWTGNDDAILLIGEYCIADVMATRRLYRKLANWYNLPENRRFTKALIDIEFPMLSVLVHMEYHGTKVDEELLTEITTDVESDVKSHLERMLENLCMFPQLQWESVSGEYVPKVKEFANGVNKRKGNISYYMDADGAVVSSNPYLVYDHCKLVPYNGAAATGHTWWLVKSEAGDLLELANKTKKGGRPQLDREFFSIVAEQLPDSLPIAKYLKARKHLEICRSIKEHVVKGRTHSSFNNCMTRTGRLSGSNPNIQNLPRADKDPNSTASKFRRLYNADAGNVLIGADLNRIELCVLGWFLMTVENDFRLTTTCNDPSSDAHQANADIWGVSRTVAKTLIFLLVYGGGAGLIYKRGMSKSLDEAEAMVKSVDKSMPAINKLKQKVWDKCTKIGYVTNPFGARGVYPELSSSKEYLRGMGERKSFNFLIQSTARDIIHMLAIKSLAVVEKYNAKMVNIVHDEMLIECKAEDADVMMKELNSFWSGRMDYLPGAVTGGEWVKGNNWYETKLG